MKFTVMHRLFEFEYFYSQYPPDLLIDFTRLFFFYSYAIQLTLTIQLSFYHIIRFLFYNKRNSLLIAVYRITRCYKVYPVVVKVFFYWHSALHDFSLFSPCTFKLISIQIVEASAQVLIVFINTLAEIHDCFCGVIIMTQNNKKNAS